MSVTTEQPEQQYAVTLDYPHASEPTHTLFVEIYKIHQGPKRITHRRLEMRTLRVPSPETWTLDTVRMPPWELLGCLPDGSTHDGTNVAATIEHNRDRVRFQVEVSQIVASTSIHTRELSEPMRAALAGMPTTSFPLKAIVEPPSRDPGAPEDSATVDEARRIEQLLWRLKDTLYQQPSLLAVLEHALDRFDNGGRFTCVA
jgi:hypothetical protein